MRALRCDSKDSFIELLRPLLPELDSFYWIVDCQMGPVRSDWIHASEVNECIFNEIHIPIAAFAGTQTYLWRPGALSKVGHALYFDEHSYFLGFHATENEAKERAVRLGLPDFPSDEFYDALSRDGQLFVVQVDGWWEFYPASETLFKRIRDCAPCREFSWPGLRMSSPFDVNQPANNKLL